jgi:integrase
VADITRYRAALASRVTAGTTNKVLKVLRGAWNNAAKQGQVRDNAFACVDLVRADRSNRRGFSLDELKVVLDACDEEWRSMVLFGFYTGQRLGDIARLRWVNLDPVRQELRLTTQKTARLMTIPIPTALLRHVESMPTPSDPDGALFPRASALTINTLCHQFTRILCSVGLAEAFANQGKGKGRDAKRVRNELRFHGLRHSATSELKNAGVSNAVAQELIGHESEAVNRAYTHLHPDTLRRAVNQLPDILAGT